MKKGIPPIVYFLRLYYRFYGLIFPAQAAKSLIRLFSTPRKKVLRKEEIAVLQLAKKGNIEVDGITLTTYKWGDGEQLAILFHGWESNAGSLGAFIDPLIKRNYRVLAFDAPAHGTSKGKHANLLYFKKAASKILKEFGQADLVIGHSLGANSIILTAFEEQIEFKKTILISPLNRLMKVFEDMNALLQLPDPLFNRFIKLFENQSGYQFGDFYFHDFGRKSPLQNVLLLHDIGDKVTGYSHSKNLAKHWPVVELKPIKDSGHYRILWSEQSLEYVTEYLDN